jgi:hypothetical protein
MVKKKLYIISNLEILNLKKQFSIKLIKNISYYLKTKAFLFSQLIKKMNKYRFFKMKIILV